LTASWHRVGIAPIPSRALNARMRFRRRSPTFISSHKLTFQPVIARNSVYHLAGPVQVPGGPYTTDTG